MKIKSVLVNEDRAVIHLSPTWWGRLFGEREVVAELIRRPPKPDGETMYWWCATTHVRVEFMHHGSLLHQALQLQPTEMPKATLQKDK